MAKVIEVTDEFLASKGHTRETYEALSKGGRWSVRNREKHRQAIKQWSDKHPESANQRARKSKLKLHYDMTQEDYDRMLKEQRGKCAICGTNKPTGKWKVFAIDHCHDTGKVRGLLCNECNRGIGLLKDNADLLRKAGEYLDVQNRRIAEQNDSVIK